MEVTQPSPKRRKLSHGSLEDSEPFADMSSAAVAESDNSEQNGDFTNETAVASTVTDASPSDVSQSKEPSIQQLSKNQLKKLRKREEWDAARDYRKAKRKEKIQAQKARKREEKHRAEEERKAQGIDVQPAVTPIRRKPVRLPITFLIDCGFDDKMLDKERISLGSQLTRSYSDNFKAPFQAHLYVSSWNGHLKERFDTVLSQQHKNWKGIEFTSEDFVGAAQAAEVAMKGSGGGDLAGIFTKFGLPPRESSGTADEITPPNEEIAASAATSSVIPPLLDELKGQGEVIYLTSDSPNTLTELKPFSTYIIGGLVDKNRHKGICYKIACDRGIKTAKLPIGQYMEMQSRYVLATNHVNEIMLRYLECGDWGESFMKVMPKRKGAKLRDQKGANDESHPEIDNPQDDTDSVSEGEPDLHPDSSALQAEVVSNV